jgi:hypothetical protein
VVVGPAHAGAAVGLDVDGGREVELRRARAVAGLPDREELCEAAAVARLERSRDRVERMRQRAGDGVAVEILGAGLDVARVAPQPVVVVGGDAPAQDVHRLRLAAEAGGELLGHEHVRAVGDLEHAGDRVVVGDRDEVHAAPLGEVVDLLRGRGALGEPEGALDAEAGLLRRGRVAVEIDPHDRHDPRFACKWATFVTRAQTSCYRIATAERPRRERRAECPSPSSSSMARSR